MWVEMGICISKNPTPRPPYVLIAKQSLSQAKWPRKWDGKVSNKERIRHGHSSEFDGSQIAIMNTNFK